MSQLISATTPSATKPPPATIPVFIKQWAAWAPGIQSYEDWLKWSAGQLKPSEYGEPPKPAIPAMLRRRLSPLGKMALSVSTPLLLENPNTPCIFASRHGELDKTVGLLRTLAQQEPLSPTQFSLSVHNAIGGIMSMALDNTNSITALATGPDEASVALLEAAAILTEQCGMTSQEESSNNQVICVIYDAPVADFYRDPEILIEPDYPYAIAFLLSDHADKDTVSLEFSLQAPGNITDQGITDPAAVTTDTRSEPQGLSLLRWMLSPDQQDLFLTAEQHCWHWRKPSIDWNPADAE